MTAAEAWFGARTDGAPEALRVRAEQYFLDTDSPDLPVRLADAGRAALTAAIRDGGERAAALDLLAADALITLALLASAEHDAASLGRVASELRTRAARSSS